jgi:hypothetical protein
MRTLLLKMTSEDGKIAVDESFSVDSTRRINPLWVECSIKDLHERLDRLDRDGPWNNATTLSGYRGPNTVVQNSLQPAPEHP